MPSFATAPIEGRASPRNPSVRMLQQILVVELGGGVAVDGERQVGRGHAAAVVGDADPPPAAAIGEDVDPAGAGVDGVLDEFLDHARGTLDHLAGGDAVDDLFGELADGHGCGFETSIRGWTAILGGRAPQMHGQERKIHTRPGDEVDLSP